MPAHVVVIGAGVTGLSAATRLQARGHRVTVVARDFPGPSELMDPRRRINYTSAWGGAHNRFVPPPLPRGSDPAAERDHAFSLETYRHADSLARSHPEAGFHFLRGVEYVEDVAACQAPPVGSAERAAELGMDGFRLLKAGELPPGVAYGCEYRTWCVSPMVYLPFLLRRLKLRGGGGFGLVRAELRTPAEAFALPELRRGSAAADVVVNCTGSGMGDDAAVFVTRGQTCLVAEPCDATVTRQNRDGSWAFCVPRGFDGGTVVGGTKEPDDWDPSPSAEVRDRLLEGFVRTYPGILAAGADRLTPIADVVGRRPTRRGGMRLEVEEAGRGRPIVHAYGLGGRGFELSWGVAGRVVELVEGSLGASRAKL